MQNIEIDCVTRKLSDGDFVVMVTDGVMDALPVGEQEAQIGEYLCELSSQNRKKWRIMCWNECWRVPGNCQWMI